MPNIKNHKWCCLAIKIGFAIYVMITFIVVSVRLQRSPPRAELLAGLKADDERLLEHMRRRVLVAPSTLPYNLHFGVDNDPSDGQDRIVDDILGGLRNGFYVESGGYTGEILSNSLFFEIQRGWRGLLIEPDNKNFDKLLSRNRKCYAANACLGESKTPQNLLLLLNHEEPYTNRILKETVAEDLSLGRHMLQMSQCFPLYSFLLALGTTTVDYFSLDVEGAEYKVLASVPWDKVNIKTLSVEYNLIPEGKTALIDLMTSNGYIHYMEYNTVTTHDLIFVKKGVLNKTIDHPLLVTERPFKPLLRNEWLKLFQ